MGYIVDTIWVAKNLTSEGILGQSSLSAIQALTFQYGGHLPPLSVIQVTSNTSSASTFTTHLPVQCFSHLHSAQKLLCTLARHQQPADKLFIRSEIQRFLKEGKIRPSNSSWRSQAFVVREPNRKPRMVIDYSQMINCVTHLDAFPIPLVSELLEQVGQYRIFSNIDLKAAFHQFWLDPKEWYLVAFEADGWLWEFTCIPFGLRNSPAAFNRALCNIPRNTSHQVWILGPYEEVWPSCFPMGESWPTATYARIWLSWQAKTGSPDVWMWYMMLCLTSEEELDECSNCG